MHESNRQPILSVLRKMFFVVLWLWALPNNSRANDSYLGTDGGNIYPQKSTHIRMVREKITIDLMKEGGEVDCQFWFVNEGETDTVIVGFPDVEISPSSANEAAKNFQTWVNQKSVPVFRDSIQEVVDSSDTLKTSWYYWKAYFKKQDTTVIQNKYFGVWGGSYCEKRFNYIIGTGNKWLGPIGSGRIVFHHGNLLSSLFVGKGFWRDSLDLKPTYFEDSTVYEFHDYTPRNRENVDLWFSSYWKNLNDTSCPGFYIPTDSLKRKTEMVNELFARSGHVFASKKLNEKFQRKPWYKPIKPLKLTDLEKNMQHYIRNLKEKK